ncbi:hypothetical protein V757_00110 [Pelistega indica]|uniref:Uncharacterized protein n=1 Tax=Pelistega indica TaxID=1414851 RepID=V8G9Q7_9BURK|nr:MULTISPECIES: hypothetical protein [Pelistega]ETD73140.1 hypothetical protein V757_00110 [Pelistega indica]
MQLTSNSKKLIIAIAAVTVLGVILTQPSADNSSEQPSESIANTSGQSLNQNNALDPTTIKSLTNLTQHVEFLDHQTAVQYRGYIQGVGYSSYQFLAEQGQQLLIELEASDKIELLLYGNTIAPIKSGVPYTIPDNGLYDLRVLYKPDIEAAQAQKATSPEMYRISFTLKAAPNTSATESLKQPQS